MAADSGSAWMEKEEKYLISIILFQCFRVCDVMRCISADAWNAAN